MVPLRSAAALLAATTAAPAPAAAQVALDSGTVARVNRRLSEEIARAVLGIDPAGARDLPLADDALKPLPGVYPLGDDRLEVWGIGGRLAARMGDDPPFWLCYQGHDRFVAEPDPTLAFHFVGRAAGRARSHSRSPG